MNRGRMVGCLMLTVGALLLAGCSVTPPRILAEPLIEIDGAHGGHHRRHERHDHHDRDRYHEGYHRDHYHDGRRDPDRHHHRQRSRFCPPGLAKQERC